MPTCKPRFGERLSIDLTRSHLDQPGSCSAICAIRMLYSGQLILMRALEKVNYYRRIFRAYLRPGQSQLNFWHDTAELNPHAPVNSLGEYYMTFARKAEFNGHYDAGGVPMLNYHGSIGSQYNPIAIAQWGLGNFNLFRRTGSSRSGRKFLLASDWLCKHLTPNANGVQDRKS